MIVYPFKAVLPSAELAKQPEQLADQAKNNFVEARSQAALKRVATAGMYVYEIESPQGIFQGFVAQTDLQELVTKNIKPHEKTLKAKEAQAKALMRKRGSLVKPIMVCHPANENLTKTLDRIRVSKKPTLVVPVSQDTIHRIWSVQRKSDINQLQHYAGFIDHAYIADGHHRSKIMQTLSKKADKHHLKVDRVLSAYFDFNSIRILDYNRMVEINAKLDLDKLLKRLKKRCSIERCEAACKPENPHEMSMLLDGQWYLLKWKQEILDKYCKHQVILDHQVFDREVLSKILKIKNVTEDQSVTYFSGEVSTTEIESRLENQPRTAAFFIRPVEIEQMVQLTEQDKTLPPKSTFFVPRLHNGIISDELS